mgnify:CR=1 FL=1
MSTRVTSAQGDPCALSVGESLLGQHGLKPAKTISATDQSYAPGAVDAQIDAQTKPLTPRL